VGGTGTSWAVFWRRVGWLSFGAQKVMRPRFHDQLAGSFVLGVKRVQSHPATPRSTNRKKDAVPPSYGVNTPLRNCEMQLILLIRFHIIRLVGHESQIVRFGETKETARCATKEREDNEEPYDTNKSYPPGWPDHVRGGNPRVAYRHGCARPGDAGTNVTCHRCECPHAPRDRTCQPCSLRPRLD
jgi:hypothetical protein